MSLDGWKRASFLVGSESDVRQWEPLPGGSVRPSGPCCFAVARAPFVSLDGWKRASFLVGSESNVRQWEPLPEGSINYARASGWWDTAFRWECDELLEFGPKLLLNAPPRCMSDTCAYACDLQASHLQREICGRNHHLGGDRFVLLPLCFAQIWRSVGRCMCTVVA